MSAAYKIIGADGREYGPITGEQIRQWIAEGRANAQTRALTEGAADWKPLGAVPEFAGQFASQIPPTIGPLRTHRTNGFATAGFVCGVISLVFCCCYGFPFNVLGAIFSAAALSQINRQPEIHEGRGLAIAGLVTSIASFLIYVIVFVVSLASGNFHFNWNTTGF